MVRHFSTLNDTIMNLPFFILAGHGQNYLIMDLKHSCRHHIEQSITTRGNYVDTRGTSPFASLQLCGVSQQQYIAFTVDHIALSRPPGVACEEHRCTETYRCQLVTSY